jgi:ubiquinone/menaquinone biosynthesis C-methylase UbiE
MGITPFDSAGYKAETRQQWQDFSGAWHRWMPVIRAWMAPATGLMLDLARLSPGSRVLDIAAGDGDQSLAAARRVSPRGYVLATDITPGMLEFALASARQAGLRHLDVQVMDGERLELEDAAFDAVICRLGLMFFPDTPKGLAEMVRVLKPGGRAAMIVFTSPERNPLFSIPIAIIRRIAQLPRPIPAQPGLFKLGGRGALENALSSAGFSQVETHILSVPLRLSSIEECLYFLKESLPVLDQLMAGLDLARRQAIWGEIRQALRQYNGAQGFSIPGEVIVGVGTK